MERKLRRVDDMTVNRSEKTEFHEVSVKMQPVVLILVAIFGALLLLAPFVPGLISNIVYLLSGEAPKIYWYLSRAGGFVALSILWISMALGLGITNKLARRWPGAPAAFAVHQYVSLLGLAFAIYHALVLIGDHFVDFSLPRLLTPFSIDYERFWVGLGQVAFYIWLIVVLSFYVRKFIGQKVWRLIHYANFAIYFMGLFHGIFSGTDAKVGWAQVYYWLSGASLLALLAYRIYQSSFRQQIALFRAAWQEVKRSQQISPRANTPVPGLFENTAHARSSAEASLPAADSTNRNPEPVPPAKTAETTTEENVKHTVSVDLEQNTVSEVVTDAAGPTQDIPKPNPSRIVEMPVPSPNPVLRIKKNSNGNVADQQSPTVPRKSTPAPVLQIQVNSPTEKDASRSTWDKVTICEIQINTNPEDTQARPSPLTFRVNENLRQKMVPSSSILRIRRKKEELPEKN
jgi:hypothetical protein